MSKLRKISELTEKQRTEHLKPEEGCIERNGERRQHRWILATFLNVIPDRKYTIRRTCGNKKCSNPHHLYFKHSNDKNIKHIPQVPPQNIKFNKVCLETQTRKERLSHIDLNQPCIERGGESYQFRGVLAQYLHTEIVNQRLPMIAHSCNNPKCSNPQHIYYASDYDNAVIDKIEAGTPFTAPPKLSIRYKIKTRCKIGGKSFSVFHLFFWNFPEVGKKKQFSMRTKCPIEAKEIYEMVLKNPNDYQSIVFNYHKNKGREIR